MNRMGEGGTFVRSLPSRGAWIEIFAPPNRPENQSSLPSRGAWIEMETWTMAGMW